MTAVAQGGPNDQTVPADPTIPPPARLGFSELQHIAQVLSKAAAFLHSKDKERLIANLADADYRPPDDQPKHPDQLKVEWIVEPALREAIAILGRSGVEPYVVHSGLAYFLMVRRRV